MGQLNFVIKGGLGNQLFQLAACRYLATKFNEQPTIDLGLLSPIGRAWTRIHGTMPRKFDVPTELILNYTISRSIKTQAKHKLRRFMSQENGCWDDIGDRNIETFVFSKDRNYMIEGYFQKLKFARLIREEILSLSFLEGGQLRGFYQYPDSIAVHLRLGDFRSDRLRHTENSIWIANSIKQLREKSGYKRVVVFSDHPVEALKTLESITRGVSIELAPPNFSPIETLIAMSTFKVRILSASTFSWWAFFLAKENQSDILPEQLLSQAELFAEESAKEVDD